MVEIKVHKCVSINLSPEDIFAYVCDLENMEEWSGVTISIRKTSPGEMSVGATVRLTLRFLGRWYNMLCEIVEYSPARCLTFKSITGGPPSLFRFHFACNGQGGTSAGEEAVIQVAGNIVEQERQMLERAVGRQIEADLWNLKEMLEVTLSPR